MNRVAFAVVAAALLASCSGPSTTPPPAAAVATAHTHDAVFVNGDFETGDMTGWTTTVGTYTMLSAVPPTTYAQLAITSPGTGRNLTHTINGTPESVLPLSLNAGDSLRVPRYGNYVAVVNEQGASNNVNVITQTFTTSNADVDPSDLKVHVRFALAPVLENPGHPDNQQPYFWAQLTNITKGNTVLFSTFNFANQAGVPWKASVANAAMLYTDWQSFDIAPGNVGLAPGDQVKLQVVAGGCGQGGHQGQVYVDGFGAFLPGLSVSAAAPQSANTGSNITYTFNYGNRGNAASANTKVAFTLPTGVTYQSLSAPGATCTAPAVGAATGVVECNVGAVNPSASGSFTVTVNITAASGTKVSAGNYAIRADGVSALIGPLVETNVTSGTQYADLAVAITDPLAALGWGQAHPFSIVVTNNGPATATSAPVAWTMPASYASATWTCSGTGTCGAASGTNSIASTATLASGQSVTYAINATVASGSGSGSLSNLATVSAPGGVTDNNSNNNQAVHTLSIGTLRTITFAKGGLGSGSVVSFPTAISCGAGCSGQTVQFIDGMSVSVTATAGTGSTFAGWSGACSGGSNPCNFTVSGDANLTATFDPPSYAITVSPAPSNGTVVCTSPVIQSLSSTCTITPAAGYALNTLTDNGSNVLASVSGGQYVIANVQAAHTIAATFAYVPPSLTVSPGTAVYDALGAPVALDPGVQVGGPNAITSAQVTIGANFQAGDVLNFTNQAGITGSYDAARGTLSLTGSASSAAYQAALASVTFSNTLGAKPSAATRTITFSIGNAVSYQANSHFYEYVSGSTWTWSQAQAAAAARTYYGLRGYLVTIGDAAENAYVSSKLQGAGWMGLSAPVNSLYPRIWSWVTGPESGTQVCNNTAAGTCTAISGAYTDWNGGEPNNSGNSEYRAQFLANGLWNDLPDSSALPGYVVEYGGTSGDPVLSITGSRSLQVRPASVVTVSPAPSHGTVVCTPSQVIYGGSSTCTVTPAAGWVLATLTDNGASVVGSLVSGQYVLSGLTGADHTIAATFSFIPPTLVVSSGSPTYDALGPALVLDSAIQVGSPINLPGATVAITGGFQAGDQLSFTNQGGISGSYNSGTGVLTLSGSATAAQYQAALASVTYSNSLGAKPSTADRTVTFTLVTGFTNASGTRTFHVRPAWLVTASPAPVNGTVVCTGSPAVYGGSASCTVTPASSYVLSALTDNGADVLASLVSGQYSLTNLTADHAIAATFTYVPPTIAVTPGTVYYDALGPSVLLDPGVLVTGIAPITGATVTVGAGFQVGDQLSFTNQAGITGSYNAATGVLTLTGSASPAAYQTALASVTYSNSLGAKPSTALRTITFALGTGVSYQANSHFYEYVSGGNWTWLQAQAAAAARTYYGLQGYLVTVTSAAENAYVASKLQGAGWMGASAPVGSGFGRTISWMTGPEAGQGICVNTSAYVCPGIAGAFTYWGANQPDNAGGEPRIQFFSDGHWNDLPDNYLLPGYVVEYGGMAGDPALSVTASRSLQVRAASVVTVSPTPSNGTVLCTGSPAIYGGSVSCTITPAVSYRLASFTDNGVDQLAAAQFGSYELTNLTADHTLVAIFDYVPPTITVTSSTLGYDALGSPVALDPAVLVTGIAPIQGATVTVGAGFQVGDQLHFVDQNGISGSYDAAKGILTLTGAASPAQYQTALASVTYSSTAGRYPATALRTITFALGTGVSYQANSHFYEYVSGGSWTWSQAQAAAAARSYFGMHGYLATIGDAAENAYVSSKLQGAGWFGASTTPGAGFPRTWSWVTGPEAGTGLCTNTASGVCTPIGGAYTDWNANEPNNMGNEFRAQFLANGQWNDLPDTTTLPGYVVEYGGLAGDPSLSVTASRPLQVRAATTVAISSTVNPSQWAGDVTFTAHFLPAASTGTAQFQIDGSDFGAPVAISGGAAQSGTISILTIGNHTVTASYAGDVERQGASGALAGGQEVLKAENGNGLCTPADAADVCVAGVCDPDGKCGFANSTGPCDAGTALTVCRTGVCDPDGRCGYADGDGTCVPGTATPVCRSGQCGPVSGICRAAGPIGCGDDRDCAAGLYCDGNTFTCALKVASGVQLPVDPRHNGGTCTAPVGAAVCVAGTCEVGDNLCGTSNNHPCAAALNCRSLLCAADGLCGVSNGGACASAVECRTGVCNADGACGTPNGGTCTSGATCRTGYCGADQRCGVPSGGTCTDGAQCRAGVCGADGRCGSPNGGACSSGTSCRAGACVNGQCSATCSSSADCAQGLYCGAASTCVPQLPNGTSCTAASQCAAGVCDSGKCGTASGGSCTSPATCVAGACVGGTCGSTCSADAQCATGFYCGGGTCVASAPNGGSCTTASQCASGICEADGKCGSATGKPCAGASDCRSGICDATSSCATTCAANGECVAGNFCDPATHACLPVAPNGGSCGGDSQCQSNVCDSDGVCGSSNGKPCGQPDNCRSGVCSADGKCGTANQGACASPTTCRSGVCDTDGQCGGANGTACTSGAACRTGICNPDGQCGVPNGGPCAAAAECRSGVCAADGVCGDDQGASCTSPATCRTGACSGGTCSLSCTADAECAAGTFCGSGLCRAGLPSGSPCTGPAQCLAGVCGGDGKCGAPEGGSCTAPLNCRTGACAAGVCGPTCASDSQCVAAEFCAAGTCTPRQPNGTSCAAASACSSGFCVAGTCGVPLGQPCSAPAQCRSGICDDVSGSCSASCATNSQCAAGSYCDATSHACQPSAPNGAPPTRPCTAGSQCTSGVCGPDGLCGAPDGSACLGGGTCRGGACAAGVCSSGCSTDAQCAAADYCAAGTCAPRQDVGATCTRPAACASGTCAADGKCGTPAGGACVAPTQCRDGACSNGTCGTSCLADAECLSSAYCSAGTCAPRLPAGTLCTSGAQCAAGVCAADGRCGKPDAAPCATATQCRSSICSAGACASTCAADADCPAGDFCDAASHACLPQGSNGGGGARTCVGPADCASGVCAPDGRCGYPTGGGSCNPVNASTVCRSGACSLSTGTCVPGGGRGCAGDVDCATLGGYCDAPTLTCTASKLPAGAPLPRDSMHGGGTCSPTLALAVCVGGVCDPADDRCGLPNARACTAGNQCRSGTCGADGQCGLPNGGACASDGVCRSGDCQDGQCGAPNGSPCAAASACVSGVCTAGVCGVPNGGPCTTSGVCRAGQCGGDGFCGQPDQTGCSSGDTCRSGSCVNHLCSPSCTSDASCASGLACLGGTCSARLPNGEGCTSATQCASGVCGGDGKCGTANSGSCTSASTCRSATCAGGTCGTTCSSDASCLATSACVSGTCVPRAAGGASCTADSQCAGGVCLAGTCGKPDGQACQAPAQCRSNICDQHGTCTSTCAATAECPAGTFCGPAHACQPVVTNGQGCSSAAQCASGICQPDGSCGYPNGGGACTAATAATVCRSGACGTSSLTCVPAGGSGCTVDADCGAGTYCVAATSTCAPKLANGQPLPKDALHHQGVCSPTVAAAVCAGGVCDPADDRCGVPNDALCSADAECRGGACGADGRCGLPNGTACAAADACRSGVCDPDGLCGSVTGACTSGADCRSGLCSAADHRCGLPGATPCASNAECRGGVCASDGRCGADTGAACTSGDACRAGACTGGSCSTTCAADGDCGAGRSCAAGACVLQVPNGSSCSRATQCLSGACGSDGKCGLTDGSACTSPAACRVACSAGTCGSTCAADADCVHGTFCQAGACVTALAGGETCTAAAQCAAGVCGSDGKCGGLVGEACVGPTGCRGGICDTHGTCAATCTANRDCATGTACDPASHACVAVVANGQACASDAQCASGTCGSNHLCGGANGDACGVGAMCQSGVCDPKDLRCGLVNGSSGCTAATAALVCRGGVCVDGTCGLAEGAVCSADAQCASGLCSDARVCAAPGAVPAPVVKGGTGCSASSGDLGLFGLLALAALGLRRRQLAGSVVRRAAGVAAALVATASSGQQALIQGYAAQSYDPSYAGDRFFAAPEATVTGHLLPAARLSLDYAYQPVRILSSTTREVIPQGVVVRDQLYLHLDLSLALIDRLRLDVGLPMAVAQTGDPQTAGSAGVTGGHLGDLRLGLRGSLLGAPSDAFALGLQGDLILPTGVREEFTGAGGVRGHLRVLASGLFGERFVYGGALGLMLASHRDLGLADTGSALTYSAGLGILFADGKLQLGPELHGATVLASGLTPLEALVGLRYRWNGLVFGGAVGAGLSSAPGTATFRALLDVAWAPLPEPPVVPVECPPARAVDASATRDSDQDGIPDRADACQFEAGVVSADPARNGCPADADQDGIPDAVDACPAQPGLKASQGCPPPPDRDGDGVSDAEDLCPDVRGPADGPKKGCPVETAELKEARIALAEQVQFANGKAELLPLSEDVLRGVAKVMAAHPELARLSIEGYTDNVGPAAYNVQLSAERAASVLEWLVKKGGIDRKRLVSQGFGSEKPLASNDDEAGRQRNRRVEVRVLEYRLK